MVLSEKLCLAPDCFMAPMRQRKLIKPVVFKYCFYLRGSRPLACDATLKTLAKMKKARRTRTRMNTTQSDKSGKGKDDEYSYSYSYAGEMSDTADEKEQDAKKEYSCSYE